MAIKTTLTLKKEASNLGGDRYDGMLEGKAFVVYVPQSLSRKSGSTAKKVTVTIEAE